MSIKHIARGTALIGVINVVRIVLQTLSVPILARLLSPEDYGLAAMAMPVVLFLMMIADAGLGNSLVRTAHLEQPAWHTCFWLSMVLGLTIGMLVALLSPLVAFLLDEPRLTPLMISLAAIIPLQTLTVVPGAALQKQGSFGTISATEIAALFASIGIAVVCATAGAGVWALIAQQIAFYASRLVLTLFYSPFRPRLIFDLHDAWEHVVFGRNLLGVSLISSASRSLETLAIGRVQGPGPTGVYSMAFQFARLPMMLATGPLQYVLYPYVAAIRDNPARITSLFLMLTRMLAIIFVPAVGLVAAASEPIFHLLLSNKWKDAAPVFVLIAPAAALQSVTAILGTFLIALGRTDVQMRLAAQFAAVWLAGLLLSVSYGIETVAAAYTVCALSFALTWSLRVCLPLLNCSPAAYARVFMRPLLLTICAIVVYRILCTAGAEHDLVNLGLALTLAFVASLIALLTQRNELLAAVYAVADHIGAADLETGR